MRKDKTFKKLLENIKYMSVNNKYYNILYSSIVK